MKQTLQDIQRSQKVGLAGAIAIQRTFPITLQSPGKNGFTFFRRIHADGRVEKKLLGSEWEPNDTPTIEMERLEKYLFQMTQRLGWSVV